MITQIAAIHVMTKTRNATMRLKNLPIAAKTRPIRVVGSLSGSGSAVLGLPA